MNFLSHNLPLPFLSQLLSKIVSSDQELVNEGDPSLSSGTAGKLVESVSNEENTEGFDLNGYLLKYKEIKQISNFTGVQPKVFVYFLIGLMLLIVINFFSKLFTLFVGIVYPLQGSISALRNNKRKEIRKWLEYWIIFFLFLNIETIFGKFMKNIPMYLFYKVVFLFICFLPWYGGAHYIYVSYIRETFLSYEKKVYRISRKISRRIESRIFKEE